jgi:hypothetical protein
MLQQCDIASRSRFCPGALGTLGICRRGASNTRTCMGR